jgi:two-component system response regulator PilR (NtrC family)
MEKLRRYEFPGNVRELRNLIERALILSGEETIGVEGFPVPSGPGRAEPLDGRVGQGSASWMDLLPEIGDLRAFLAGLEKDIILRTLRSTHGAQAEAARRLGLSRSDLGYKLAKFGYTARD